MKIRNEDIISLELGVPEGHKHLRAVFTLEGGSVLELQEATVANLVRAYTTLKTHPLKTSLTLKGRRVEGQKKGYADWQLLEDD